MVLARAFPLISPTERLNLVTQLFDHLETLDRLCLISGGHVRDLLGLLFDCLREQDPPFDHNCVELVIQRQRDYRANAIDINESELILQVIQDQQVRGNVEYDILLRSLFVFEYHDYQGVWFALNPVLAEIEKFKLWLKDSKQII